MHKKRSPGGYYIIILFIIVATCVLCGTTGIHNDIIHWPKYKAAITAQLIKSTGCSKVVIDNLSGSLIDRALVIRSMSLIYSDEASNTMLAVHTSNVKIAISLFSLLWNSIKIKSIACDKIAVAARDYRSIYGILEKITNSNDQMGINISVNDGQVIIANERVLYDIKGVIDPSKSKDLLMFDFFTGQKRYSMSASEVNKQDILVDIAGPDFQIKYEGNLRQEGSGKVSVSGTDISTLIPIFLGEEFACINCIFRNKQPFVGSGSINYSDGHIYIHDFTLEAQNFKAQFANNMDKGFRDIDMVISHINLDSFMGIPKDKESIKGIPRNRKAETLLSMSRALVDGKDPSSLTVSVGELIWHNQRINGILMSFIDKGNGYMVKEVTAANLPYNTSAKYLCDDITNEAKTSCSFYIKSADAQNLLPYIGINIEEYYGDIFGQSNSLDITGNVVFAFKSITIPNVVLSTGNNSAVLHGIVKELYGRPMVRGEIVTNDMSIDMLIDYRKKAMKNIAKQSKSNLVVNLNTMPWDLELNFRLLNMKPNGSVSFVMSYDGSALKIKNISMYSKDKVDISGGIVISATDLIPTVNLTLDSKLIYEDEVPSESARIKLDNIIDELKRYRGFFYLFQGSMAVNAEQLRYKNTMFSNFKMDLEFNNGAVNVKKIAANGLEGSWNLTGSVGVVDNYCTLALNVDSINCGTLATLMTGTDKIYGYCSTASVFRVTNSKGVPWASSMTGNMQWAISDMRVLGLDIGLINQFIMGVRNQSQLASLLDSSKTNGRPYAIGNVNGTTVIKNDLASNNISFSGNTASGSGIVNILLSSLLMNGLIRFEMIPLGGSYPISVDVAINGSTLDPDLSYDINKLTGQIIY